MYQLNVICAAAVDLLPHAQHVEALGALSMAWVHRLCFHQTCLQHFSLPNCSICSYIFGDTSGRCWVTLLANIEECVFAV